MWQIKKFLVTGIGSICKWDMGFRILSSASLRQGIQGLDIERVLSVKEFLKTLESNRFKARSDGKEFTVS